MRKQIHRRRAEQELFYPIILKKMTEDETKQYHRKKLYEMTKNLRRLNLYDDFDYQTIEQRDYVEYRMNHPETWPRVKEIKIGEFGE